ncbi:uncharacterized protein LOC121431294 [Lytechinus variegatus]|uniref:uncharacterized protein LOC121431294 n=1 Tax=Lytechinus variegatus TaxID=7654 RepID=UPI001BB18782|nr:uncharacterized protein LOC121431294 [Lytechinus variegatus]
MPPFSLLMTHSPTTTISTLDADHLEVRKVAVIKSPNHPRLYCNNLNVTWLVSVPPAYQIRLHFDSFSTEKGPDFVTVNDGWTSDYSSSTERRPLSGSIDPGDIVSNGSYLWVQFTTNNQGRSKGFRALLTTELRLETLRSNHNVLIITSVSVAVLVLLSFSVFGYISWKKRTKDEQDDGQQEGQYMDLTPSVTSSPTYEALGAVRLSKTKESPTTKDEQDDGQQEGQYMDLTPSVTSSPTYEALGAVRLSKTKECPTYENKSVVKHHQNIHGITTKDEHPYELPN